MAKPLTRPHSVTPPRLFVLDVDGTVLTSDHRVTERSKATVAACRALGAEVMLASSRPPGGLTHVLRELDLHHSAAFIACQGAILGQLDPIGSQSLLAHTPLPLDAARRVASVASDLGVTLNWFTLDNWYVSRVDRAVELEAAVVGLPPTLRDIGSLDAPPAKLMFMGPDLSGIVKQIEQYDDVQATLSNPTYLEVTRRGVSKASAVQRYCEEKAIPLSCVAAIGDGHNDLELFDLVGTSVAPANAHQDVLARAKLHTRSNDEEGIAAAMAYLSGLTPEPPL